MPLRDDCPDLSGFGDVSLLRPLHGGHRNWVWLASFDAGLYVAKSSRRSDAAIAWLLPVHRYARAAGFLVPEMMRTTDGHFLCNGWLLERFIEGRPAGPADMPALFPRLRQMHHLGKHDADTIGQRPGFCSARDLVCGATHGGDIDMAALPAELAARCRKSWAGLVGKDLPIHADFGAGNVILTPQGPALIDWDEARLDMALFDLPGDDLKSRNARLAWEIACSWRTEPDHACALALNWSEIPR